jgi:hypothetical protein
LDGIQGTGELFAEWSNRFSKLRKMGLH